MVCLVIQYDTITLQEPIDGPTESAGNEAKALGID